MIYGNPVRFLSQSEEFPDAVKPPVHPCAWPKVIIWLTARMSTAGETWPETFAALEALRAGGAGTGLPAPALRHRPAA